MYCMWTAEEVAYHAGLVIAELRHIAVLGGREGGNQMTRCL